MSVQSEDESFSFFIFHFLNTDDMLLLITDIWNESFTVKLQVNKYKKQLLNVAFKTSDSIMRNDFIYI